MMHNPMHPGQILNELYLEPLNLNVTMLAKRTGLSQMKLEKIVSLTERIGPYEAAAFACVFNTTVETWLNKQYQYDLWKGLNYVQQNYRDITPIV